MRNLKLLSFLSVSGFLGLVLNFAQATELRLPVPDTEVLPNGLELVWFVNDSLPVVDLALLVKSGYRDDPAGKSGTTELVSATLDRGAGGMTAQQIALATERLGASRYATADDDTFSVGMHGLAPDADALLDLLAKIALKPEFPDAEVTREKARILDRWGHLADYGETLVDLAFRRLMTANTTYGRGSMTSAENFKKVGRDDVLDYYRQNFTPKNSLLMVVGRVNRPEFRKKIEALFGSWQGEAPARHYVSYRDPRLPKFNPDPGKVVLINRSDLTQAEVRMGFLAPSIHAPEHYSLGVANALLGEYFNSRLNSLIRDKLGLTYSIASAFAYEKDYSSFAIGCATRNETVGGLVEKTIGVLKGLKNGPIAPEEVSTAKDYLVGGFPLSTSTLGAVAARWLSGYVFDRGPNYLNEFVPKIEGVTQGEVEDAVKKDFDLSHLMIVIVGDSKEVEKSLREAGIKSIQKIELKQLQ